MNVPCLKLLKENKRIKDKKKIDSAYPIHVKEREPFNVLFNFLDVVTNNVISYTGNCMINKEDMLSLQGRSGTVACLSYQKMIL
jgi:hypothetical protein